ncbi:hypothetical protein L596_007057 [Steinernema carpocapsae]|uniref:Carboxylic ester hydrolase n=1 Tax=Steinernema carpocapsae TaxID=34508 RepID=A0A4V6A5V7_STECR|nr:hypothetical protein L596_007057 [Steinernema carpocapsae]
MGARNVVGSRDAPAVFCRLESSMSSEGRGRSKSPAIRAFSANKLVARLFQYLIAALWAVPVAVALLLILSYLGFSYNPREAENVIHTPYGPVEGFEFEGAQAFLGIPFAKPPVGERRLEKPERVEKWTETRPATDFGSSCVTAAGWTTRKSQTLSEDCLFMNIMKPKEKCEEPSGCPVFVFIYGGGYETGSSTTYGYKEIVKNFVSQGFVFVTFNYRLGPLGFLTTTDKVLPGNLGLWDQQSALEFVKEVIPSFGGNPEEVTISGESAGGSSVSALTLSPHTNGLFKRAIQMSGSVFCSFSISERIGEESARFIDVIGCKGSPEEAKKCLKKKTLKEYAEAHAEIGPAVDRIIGLRYNPRIDGDFFPSDLHTMIKDAPKIPTISGITTAEMGAFVLFNENFSLIDVPQRKWNSFNEASLQDLLKKMSARVKDLYELMAKFYVKRTAKSEFKNSSFYLTRLVEAGGDITFNVPMFQEALEKLENGWPVHLYLEVFYNKNGRENVPVEGAFHGNELTYLFGRLWKIIDSAKDDDGIRFKKNVFDGFLSFARTGKPIVGNVSWAPITPQKPDRFLKLDVESHMEDGMLRERMDFWTKEVPSKVSVSELTFLLPGASEKKRQNEL